MYDDFLSIAQQFWVYYLGLLTSLEKKEMAYANFYKGGHSE